MRFKIQVTMILAIVLCGFVLIQRVYAAPSAFSLISPEDGKSVLTRLLLDWSDSADPDGLTYTIFISKGNDSFGDSDDIKPIRGITGSCYVLGSGILEDNTKYYWKVQAMSNYGETSQTEVRYFTTNNGNPVQAWIGGHVYISNSKPLVNIDIITSKIWNKVFSLKTDSTGRFCGQLNSDNSMNSGGEEKITIEIGVKGCNPKSVPATIVMGELTELPDVTLKFDGIGDINGDCCHDLKDAISALQILSGQPPSQTISRCKDAALDPNPDKRSIGLAELIYILQRILEPSPCSK